MLRPRRNNHGSVQAIDIDDTPITYNNNIDISYDSPNYYDYKKTDTYNNNRNDKIYSLSPLDKWKSNVFNNNNNNNHKNL